MDEEKEPGDWNVACEKRGYGAQGTDQVWSCWVLYSVSPEEIWVSLLLEPHSFRVICPERI